MKIVLISLVLLLLKNNIQAQIQLGQAINGEEAYNWSGDAVSLSSDGYTLAIGAALNDGSAPNSGHVRIFSWSGSAWIQKGLDIDGEATEDRSGFSVSMNSNGTLVAIGARDNSGNGDHAGHVRIFSWNGSTWLQRGADIDGTAAYDFFGTSVSLSPDGNNLVVGVSGNDENGLQSGQVRVYRWNGSAWEPKGIAINGEAAEDRFGTSVAQSPDGNTFIAGAYRNGGNGFEAGHVRIFTWNGSAWIQKGTDIDGELPENHFGTSVSMSSDGNSIAIGAPDYDADSSGIYSSHGHVLTYSWNGSIWVQKGAGINGDHGDNTGTSVSMSSDGNRIAIGQPGNQGNGNYAGRVRIYQWDGSAWAQNGMDMNGEASSEMSNSGRSVSISSDGGIVAIGAPGYNLYTGQVQAYRLKGVSGIVYNDINENCIRDSELGIEGKLAVIQPGNIVLETQSDGKWYIDELPIGTYTISYDTSGKWRATCQSPQSFTVLDPNIVTIVSPFGFVSTEPCTEPNVSITMPFMRPGFSSQKVYVNACNGTIATGALSNAYTGVQLDELFTVTSASLPYTNLGENNYRFDLGDLNPGQCVNFDITTTLSALAVLGQTLCLEANLFPADSCVYDTTIAPIPPDFTPCSLPWDKSSISVNGWCQNDSIFFTITNTGEPGGGDMQCFSPVRLFIDGQYMWLDSIQLGGGSTDTLIFAGDGRTWRLEVDQHPMHPGFSHPNSTIERCGSPINWTPNLKNMLPHDDDNSFKDIYCGIVTGSYDPNDKQGYPLGVTDTNYIAPNGKIDYLIRFQNTGTDTAFTVVVRDTLDLDYDIFSVRSGAASHSYSFRMYGPRVLEWTFNAILLPDSTTNEPASNGFISFTIDQIKDLPDFTEINNTGNIYFDFNPPIITNTTSHVVKRYNQNSMWTHQINESFEACTEFEYNGIVYSNTGEYWQISSDTLITLDLIIKNSTIGTDVITTCEPYTWINGFTYTTSNNTAKDTLINAAGCDSIVTLNLTINTIDISIDNTSPNLTANQAGAFYQWIDCNSGNVPIPGETNQSFTASANGQYAVLITENGCTDTSTCILISNVGLIENGLNLISLFPNPTDGLFHLDLDREYDHVTVTDVRGKEIKRQNTDGQQQLEFNLEAPAGIYFVTIVTKEQETVILKLIKN